MRGEGGGIYKFIKEKKNEGEVCINGYVERYTENVLSVRATVRRKVGSRCLVQAMKGNQEKRKA